MCLGRNRLRGCSRIGNLEPTLTTFYISADEFFIGFGEVHDAFYDSNYLHDDSQHAARQKRHQKHDDAFRLVSQNEFVNAKGAKEETTDPRNNFLVSAPLLPVLAARLVHRRRGLDWLITRLIFSLRLGRRLITNQRQGSLTMGTNY